MNRLARRPVAAAAALATALAWTDTPASDTLRAEQRLVGRVVPDVVLTLSDGGMARLSSLSSARPLLLTLYYRRCPGVCQPWLAWARDAVQMAGGAGRDYDVLAVTLDDAETAADLRAQAASLGLLGAPGWRFARGEREAVSRLARAIDEQYQRGPDGTAYEHSALLVGIEQGRVVRSLLGRAGGSERVRELLWELRGGFVSAYRVPGGVRLRCLVFDPATGTVRLDWGLLLLALPAIAATLLAWLVFGGRRLACWASPARLP